MRLGTTENVKVAWINAADTTAPTWEDQNLSGAVTLAATGAAALILSLF